MKKNISLILVLILMLTVFLTGCEDTPETSKSYAVNSTDTIRIGALLPLSGKHLDIGEKISEGLMYAHELADSIKIDKKYGIELVIKDSSDLTSATDELIKMKVAAVICAGGDKESTDDMIECFDGYDIPLIFTDNNSSLIADDPESFTLGIGYAYQASSICADAASLGFMRGAVICCEDDPVFTSAADMFEKSFSGTITKYYIAGENVNYSAKVVASGNYDFIVLLGNTVDCKAIASDLKSNNTPSVIYMSEVADKSMLENSELDDIRFISKMEFDDDNYVGSVFLSGYSEQKSKLISKITSAEGYGYDGYMIAYEALHSIGRNNVESILPSTEPTTVADSTDPVIMTSDVLEAIKSSAYMGVTDIIKFDDSGAVNANFVYVDKLNGKNSQMVNKYNFNNQK